MVPPRPARSGPYAFILVSLAAELSMHAVPALAAPDDLTGLSLEQLMQEPVTSVSKKSTKLTDSAAAIAVVTKEDIRRLGITSLPEALRLVPGLDVAQVSSNEWAVSARGFNSEFATKLLVLIDGRSVYTPASAGVFWNAQDVMIEDVERIEVIRGPGATLWGANAVNGVINIITKSARDTQGIFAAASAASDSNTEASGRFGGTWGPDLQYRLYAKYLDQGDYFDTSRTIPTGDWHTERAGFRLDWAASSVDGLTLQGDFYGGRSQAEFSSVTPGLTAFLTDRVAQDDGGSNLLGRWTHTFSAESVLSLQTYFDHVDQGYSFGTEHRDTYDIDFQHSFRWAANDFVWGTGFRLSRIDEQSSGSDLIFSPEFRDIQLFNFFIQDEYTLVPERLRVTLGTKFEHTNIDGGKLDPNVRLAFTPTENQTLWSAVSRATRTPALFELDGSATVGLIPAAVGGIPLLIQLQGNPDLIRESLLAYEIGYRFAPSPSVSLDVSSFLNRYSNGIISEPDSAVFSAQPVPHAVLYLMQQNALDAKTYGIEAEVRWQVSQRWQLTGAYTWLHIDSSAAPALESQSPSRQFQIRSYFDLPKQLELNAALYYTSPIMEPAGPTTLGIPAYVRGDIGMLWRPNDAWSIGIWGKNLFESRHLEFASQTTSVVTEIPRSVLGKVTWSF